MTAEKESELVSGKEHVPTHKIDCKTREAELHDEILFRQPESSNFGDCPICMLPLSLDKDLFSMMFCCSKNVCNGCVTHFMMTELRRGNFLKQKCPFCRTPMLGMDRRQLQHRADMNDPLALREEGIKLYEDEDYQSAFTYLSKAAEMGDASAHYQLAIMYCHEHGVEKDEPKAEYHYEQAAIRGHAAGRYNLGCIEWEDNGNAERGVKHFIIGAKLGHDLSLEYVKDMYKAGLVRKDDFAAALRGHQAAVDATKSPHREKERKMRQKCLDLGLPV